MEIIDKITQKQLRRQIPTVPVRRKLRKLKKHLKLKSISQFTNIPFNTLARITRKDGYRKKCSYGILIAVEMLSADLDKLIKNSEYIRKQIGDVIKSNERNPKEKVKKLPDINYD